MPRDRTPPKRARWNSDALDYDEHLTVLLQMSVRTVTISEWAADEQDQFGRVVVAFTPRTGGMELTHLNMAELNLFRTIIEEAIKRAEPIVRERDRWTEEEYKRGNIRNRRLWRAEPRYIEFPEGKTYAGQTNTDGVPDDTPGEGFGPEHDQSI